MKDISSSARYGRTCGGRQFAKAAALLGMALLAVSAPAYAQMRVYTLKDIERLQKERALEELKKKPLTERFAKASPVPCPDTRVAEEELPALTQSAEQGDAAAMIRLGHYYMMRPQADGSHIQAAGEWFNKAAQADETDGLAWLALFEYMTRPGYWATQERKLYERVLPAARRESLVGMHLAGLTAVDFEEKKSWYSKAARMGFVPSMAAVAELLIDHADSGGYDAEKVTKEAYEWIELAERYGDFRAYTLKAKDINKIGYEAALDNLEKKLHLVRQSHWSWFGVNFGIRIASNVSFYCGGLPSYERLLAYRDMTWYAHISQQDPRPIIDKAISELQTEAEAGDSFAQAALLQLSDRWKFWIKGSGVGTSAPYDATPYYNALLQKADAGDLIAQGILQERSKE